MECHGCGREIDEEYEDISYDYIGEAWHTECLEKESR